MVIPEKIRQVLDGNERPTDLRELEIELENSRAKGYTVIEQSYDEGIYTKEQAEQAINRIGMNLGSVFAHLMIEYRYFPKGKGDELHSLSQIIDEKESQFHEEECPGIYDRFLQISSIEGEGSYFYEIASDIVYDTDWGEEASMMNGELDKRWNSYLDFINWYYSENEQSA